MLCCILYVAACMSKHVAEWGTMALGSVTGGVAMCLLSTSFESWMVAEHKRRGFDPQHLKETFSMASFGSGVAAIVAGELGTFLVEYQPLTKYSGAVYFGGLCSPFDGSMVFFLMALALVMLTWTENFVQRESSVLDAVGGTCRTLTTISADPRVFHCGVVTALSEASGCLLMFKWASSFDETDALSGHMFVTLMAMRMCGSQLCTFLTASSSVEAVCCLSLGAGVLFNVVFFASGTSTLRYLALLGFEVMAGLCAPLVAYQRSSVVPDEARSAVYAWYRFPLNILVVFVLVLQLDSRVTYGTTALMLCVACVSQCRLLSIRTLCTKQFLRVTGAADPEFGLDERDSLPPQTVGGRSQ